MIRDFNWTDIPAATIIEQDAFPDDTWSPESFWGELARSAVSGRYFAAEVDQKLAGYAGVAFAGDDAHLQTIAVAEVSRGEGVGRGLLAAVCAEAVARKSHRCLLDVRPHNEAAIALYSSVGFRELAIRPGYYPGGGDALVMAIEFVAPTGSALQSDLTSEEGSSE